MCICVYAEAVQQDDGPSTSGRPAEGEDYLDPNVQLATEGEDTIASLVTGKFAIAA